MPESTNPPLPLLPSSPAKPERQKQLTVPEFVGRKKSGRKISVLTAYDYAFAQMVDQAGVDCILVGDSLSMVVQGHSTTLPVTLDEMIYHAEMVGRAVRNAMVIVDLPFPTNYLGVYRTIEMAGRILKETRCQAVKLEGGKEQAEVIAGLSSAGIPVMAHVGLRPQSVHQMGGYKVQRDEDRLIEDALAAETAGAFGVLLECIPGQLAKKITAELRVPTIGIGAGPDCDGQVLVLHDMLGLTSGYTPKFVRRYGELGKLVEEATKKYCADVASGKFPSSDEQYA